MFRFSIKAMLLLSLFFLSACHKVEIDPPSVLTTQKSLSYALTPTWLHSFHSPVSLQKHTALYSLENGVDALSARLYLIDHATHTIDVQYYIYKDDLTANEFSYRLLKAAERGVKVRILIDDLDTTGKDKGVAMMASHPNIDIKLFNPNHFRSFFRTLALLLNNQKLGKRMHNKTFIVDGKAVIMGGRNIGDEYFEANTKIAFLDYDILALGNVVPQASTQFDLYWFSSLSVAYTDVITLRGNQTLYNKMMSRLHHLHHRFQQTPLAQKIQQTPFMHVTKQHPLLFYPSQEATLYYDLPHKVVSDPNDRSTHLSRSIEKAIDTAKKSLIVISPYFIPSSKMMENIRKLRQHHVSVTVITNSLASTDVPLVYSGYKSYIRPLLEMGVKLYELKPSPKKSPTPISLSLHTKMILIDNHQLIVGSANLDPRSDKLNTEVLMLIKKSPLIPLLKKKIHTILNPDFFYQLTLIPRSPNSTLKRIVWKSIEEGKTRYYRLSPNTGIGKRIGVDLFSLLPIEGYL